MRVVLLVVAVLAFASPALSFDATELTPQAVLVRDGFVVPVSLAFAPDGRMFVTEKAGTIHVVDGGPPRVWASVAAATAGEQGLLGLALHPDFTNTPWVYVYYTDASNGTNRVVRYTDTGGLGTDPTLVFDGIPRATFHNGGILGFGPDGTLFVTTGDATIPASSQDLGVWSGKVLRLGDDGTIPADNPFPGSPVYTYGHRNVFGLMFDPVTGRPWITENGPSRHDEVNALTAGGNFGWPEVTGMVGRSEFVDPVFAFDFPLPALTQGTFLRSGAYGETNRHALFFGGWNNGIVYRAILTPDRQGVSRVEAVQELAGWGILDVETGPDGLLYVSASRGGAGAIFALRNLPPVGASQSDHILTFAIGVTVVGILAAVYLRRRRRLRRERS